MTHSKDDGNFYILDPNAMAQLKYSACAPCAAGKNHFRTCLLCRTKTGMRRIPVASALQKTAHSKMSSKYQIHKVSYPSVISEKGLLLHFMGHFPMCANQPSDASSNNALIVGRNKFGLCAHSAVLMLRRSNRTEMYPESAAHWAVRSPYGGGNALEPCCVLHYAASRCALTLDGVFCEMNNDHSKCAMNAHFPLYSIRKRITSLLHSLPHTHLLRVCGITSQHALLLYF